MPVFPSEVRRYAKPMRGAKFAIRLSVAAFGQPGSPPTVRPAGAFWNFVDLTPRFGVGGEGSADEEIALGRFAFGLRYLHADVGPAESRGRNGSACLSVPPEPGVEQ